MRRILAGWMVLLTMAGFGLTEIRAAGTQPDPPAWASPSTKAIKRVNSVNSAQNEPNFLSNLDCSLVDYRLVAGNTMQTGCFSATAFGLIDSDTDTVIYNGTDEGLPLLPFLPHQVLAPWPAAGDLISLSPALINGSYISLYKSLGNLQEQRNILGQLVSKQLSAPPDLRLLDPTGQPLVINPQTLAFSDGGSWLVAEDLSGSFVRVNLASLEVLAFAPSYIGQNGYDLLKSQVAVSHDGRYAAINNESTGEFKVYDLTSCSGTAANLLPLNCRSYDYRSYIAGQIGSLRSIRHVRFVNDGLLSFAASTGDPAQEGIYEMAPTGNITSLIDYLGLGDSYTSGEGAFDYLSGTDNNDSVCHLSVHSYPLLLTRDLFSAQGGHSVACSGAHINDISSTSDNYRGQVKNAPSFQQLEQGNQALLDSVSTNFLPGYIAQHRFVSQYQPGATTVSIGGNDIGFGDIVQACVAPHISLHAKSNTCFSTYEDRQEIEQLIDRTIPRWTTLYKQLQAEAPASRLFAIGYPQIAWADGNCALNVHLNRDELVFTSKLIDYLNGSIARAAAKASVAYVDISQALAGHRLCETASYNVAVNGLTAGDDFGAFGISVLGRESYHPNALGQALIKQAILRQTQNLLVGSGFNSGQPDPGKLNQAPKTGRTTNSRLPASLTSQVIKAGQPTSIKLNGSQASLKPGSYPVRLDGPNGIIVGSITIDDSGSGSGSVIIPPDSPPGGHNIDVSGQGQTDEPVDASQPVYIPATDNDSDGDGTPDNKDSCPYAVNSGIDTDRDGKDDSCDPVISQPPETHTDGINDLTGSGSNGSPSITGQVSHNPSNLNQAGITVASSLTLPHVGGITRALGSSTASPQLPLKSTQAIAQNARLPALTRLPSISWFVWLPLPALLWLLILLAGLAKKRLNKNVYPK